MEILLPFLTLVLGAVAGTAAALTRARREQRRREEEDRKRRDEELHSLLGTMASGIAHEIRNPLSTLRMNLQLLREDWENPITEREQKGRKRIDVLLRETERMESVVSDFVRFAAGHALRLEPTNLNSLTGELLDFLAPQAERARIKLVRDFDRELPPVQVDPNLIRQAILNLLVNAQQVLPSGGEIRVRTQENGQFVKLSVADNGPGIPSEHREKIFNLYFSTKPGGTGLGLPMVKKIVEEHHGAIEVETELKKGTTFTICLKK
ncbi:MAG: two-component sensor histidine kinase [Planctomycetaceae bacterium]|nr:two-component sensor histidine kinase [Planctomycetaceae bacterium]